jgi:hypothetical protein
MSHTLNIEKEEEVNPALVEPAENTWDLADRVKFILLILLGDFFAFGVASLFYNGPFCPKDKHVLCDVFLDCYRLILVASIFVMMEFVFRNSDPKVACIVFYLLYFCLLFFLICVQVVYLFLVHCFAKISISVSQEWVWTTLQNLWTPPPW